MNRKWLIPFLVGSVFLLAVINLVAFKSEIVDIEEQNIYRWQKYMNENEYMKLQKGIFYIDAVEIAGGAGVKMSEGIYEWNDEILLTKGYRVYFKKGQLIWKEVVTKKGYSNR